MYREANTDEPKEILVGLSVAGLVGVVRQLGDLADFAAEIFHGLQEEVMRTSSRSHELRARVQRIETALSPLEKALLAKRSHLQFAYTSGFNWHAPIRCETNQFLYSDGPQFILESYEECHDPPRLHKLDRFDPGGHGSCLKRYSDPSLFKRSSVASGEAGTDEVLRDKKGHNTKGGKTISIWRVKVLENVIQNSKPCRSFDLQSLIAVNHSVSRISQQQPKSVPLNHDQNFLTTNELKSMNSNGEREDKQGNNVNEKEDFLYQIRSKADRDSKANCIFRGPVQHPSHFLEKANAISQAVGSDDVVDKNDDWSDT